MIERSARAEWLSVSVRSPAFHEPSGSFGASISALEGPAWFASAPRPVVVPGPMVQATYEGTSGNDTFTGTANPDVFFMGDGGRDKVDGGLGNDQIFFDTAFTAGDQIDGGGGMDIVTLEGDYSSGVVFKPDTVVNVETIQLAGGFDYGLTLNEGTVGAGHSCTITGGPNLVTVDASADTDAGLIKMIGWVGADTLIGGAGVNILQGRGNGDFLDGGGGNDVFVYSTAAESMSTHYDTIQAFEFRSGDVFDLPFAVTGIDDKVMHGSLSTDSFNEDLAAAIDEAHLAASHAVLFRPDSGTLDGKIFLVIDGNATAGYQSAGDMVVLLEDPVRLTKLNQADFI